MQRSTTHLDPFLFLSRCWSSMAWKAGSQPRHECFQQHVMRFSMDKPPEEMMQGCAGPLKSPSATNKGTIFCRNGIFQLSSRCSLCRQAADSDLTTHQSLRFCTNSSFPALLYSSSLSGVPDMGSVTLQAHSNSNLRSHVCIRPELPQTTARESFLGLEICDTGRWYVGAAWMHRGPTKYS